MSNMWMPPKMSFTDATSYQEEIMNDGNDEEDDAEDYMSDAFLSKCVTTKEDIRPGLAMSHSAKRLLEVQKKKEEKRAARHLERTKKVTPKERLETGLSTALGENNKGFAMLQKMGYKPGTSLGKEGSGRIEPIRMEVKPDRGGLGLKEMLRERKREKEQRYLARTKKRNMEFDPDKYREQKKQQLLAKHLEADLSKCQRVCYRLDSEQELTEPMEWYFWPSYMLPSEDDYYEEEDTDGDTDQAHSNKEDETWHEEELCQYEEDPIQPWQTELQVDLLTTYLRNAYYYCVWCGTSYDDEQDLAGNCPGTTRQDHDD